MTDPTLFRIAAFVVVVLALGAIAFELVEDRPPEPVSGKENPKSDVSHPCLIPGSDNVTDPSCLADWIKQHQRFLKTHPRSDRFEPAKPEDAL